MTRRGLPLAIGIVGAALLEAAAAATLWWGGWRAPAVASAALAHAAASALAARRLSAPGRPDERLYLFAVALALPVLGLVGVVSVRVWAAVAPPTGLYEDAHAQLGDLPAPELEPESVDRVAEWVQAQVSVQPLADLIRAGDPRMQRWAIDLVSRRSDGGAVELLREALGAADRDVQIAASAALGRVEERLMREIARAQERTRETPDSAAAWHALGEAYREYCASGLLDPTMERDWLEQALTAFGRARACRPGWLPAAVGLGHVLLGLGRFTEAEAVAREASEAGGSSAGALLLAEVLYRGGRWVELRAVAGAAVRAGHGDERLQWWAGERA